MRQKQKRDEVGRFTESARVNRKVILARGKQLFRIAFGSVFLMVPVFMAAIEHMEHGRWYFDGAAIEFPVIETVQAVESEPVDIERLLLAICTVESNCTADRVGDGGRSFGAFQINLDAHPNVTIEQAFDFDWSKRWTLEHCKRYIDTPEMFSACHNGIGKYPRNQWYVDRVMAVYNGSI